MRERIKGLLAGRHLPLVAALIAVVLAAPTLGAGMLMDDYPHRYFFLPGTREPGGPRADWDLFGFQGPDRGYLRLNMDRGLWPWWTPPDFRLAFLRPLSSLLHAVDYRLWPDHPWIMHAESVAVYGGVALLAALLYRRLVRPAWAAGLAALLFAADDAHAFVVTWIANRHSLLSALFGLWSLHEHDRARQGGRRPSAVAAPLLFALALLAGEGALAVTAYLFAYALFLDEAPLAERARSLLPYAGVAAGWTLVYKVLGYGAIGGGFYVDPGREPAAFLAAVGERMPQLLVAQFFGFPSESWMPFTPEQVRSGIVTGLLLLALLLAAFWRVLAGDRTARFFTTGMLLSLVPACATWPNDRLLLFSGLGAFGLVAMFLARLGEAASRLGRVALRVVAAVVILVHAVAAPLLLPARSILVGGFLRGFLERGDATLPRSGELAGRTVVVLNAPDVLVTSYVVTMRMIRGEPLPHALRLLSIATRGAQEIDRVDARTLGMTLSEGFFHDPFSTVFRSKNVRFAAGDRVDLDGFRATIAETLPDGRPRRVLFHFDEPLDSPKLAWVRWEKTGFVPAAPPPEGEPQSLPALDYMEALTGQKP